MEEKEVLNVDMDIIKELRNRGKWIEADKLLQAWRDNVEKNKKQVKREIHNQYNQIRKIKNPGLSEKLREYKRKYNQRPEVKERTREYLRRPEVKEKRKELMKKYHQQPEVKEKAKEYNQKPETQEKRRAYQRSYYHRNKNK